MATKGLTTNELLELFDEELEQDEEGIYNYVEYNQSAHCICIKFDKIFNRDDIKQHNIFKIQHKRYYSPGTPDSSTKPMLPTICNDINYIFNQDNDAIRMYVVFSMKIALKEKNEYPDDQFKQDIIDFVNHIKPHVDQYVDENYKLELTDNNEKINTDLQVTDGMNKAFIKSAIAMRIVIPIICEYTLNDKVPDLFYLIFREIMKIFSSDGYQTIPKLMSIIRSRVEQTKYANKKIWKLLLNHTKDVKTLCEEFKVSLIESIIPKLDINRSSIKYIDVVLRKKLEFAFTYNFPCDYRPLRNLENDDDTDERDRLNETIFVNRKNESELAMNKLTIESTIAQCIEESEITEESLKHFKQVVLKSKPLNNIQKYFLFLAYGRKFEVNVSTENERVILLYNLLNKLSNEGFIEIPKILNATVENEVDVRNKVTGKKVKNVYMFEKVLKKYNGVEDILEKDNFIAKCLDFKNYVYHDANDNIISVDSNGFNNEIYRFFQSII